MPPTRAVPSVRALEHVREEDLDALSSILVDCVEGGASVSFLQPLSRADAVAFWREVAAEVEARRRALLVVDDAQGIAGTVQVILGMPPNQPHRAEVAKMLVHRRARRRGLGEALMRAAEDTARVNGRTLLVLDTASGGDAERLYQRLGWQLAGCIPEYALWPDGRPCSTSILYRRLTR